MIIVGQRLRRRAMPIGAGVLFAFVVVSSGQNAAPTPRPASESSIYDEDPSASVAPPIPDKIEGVNRAIFKFNDEIYHYILRPVARGYAKIVPVPVRRGIGSFFHNLAFPTRFAGNVLEGHLKDAGIETGRFVVNTVTSLGFVATADQIHSWPERPSDLGQAFGSWGIGHGTYIVLPLLGPSSVRDGVGLGLSGYFLDPVHYIPKWKVRTAVSVLQVTNESPELMNDYDTLKSGSIDAYVALRDAYSSRRSRRIVHGSETPVIPAATAVAPGK